MRRHFLYIFFSVIVLATYAWADFRGREFVSTKQTFAPQSMRGVHGGRSFWYSGYHGGK